MDYVRLGSAGLKVSRICLGCMSFGKGFEWMLPEEASSSIVRKALAVEETAALESVHETQPQLPVYFRPVPTAR
jgi:hypothetical protein